MLVSYSEKRNGVAERLKKGWQIENMPGMPIKHCRAQDTFTVPQLVYEQKSS